MQSITVKNVRLLDESVEFVSELKNINNIFLSDINSIIVETNDTGPIHEDFFIVLAAIDIEIKISQSDSSFMDVLKRLQDFDGFNNKVFIEAASSVENKRFVCWENK